VGALPQDRILQHRLLFVASGGQSAATVDVL